jgi:hypothetical protein
MSPAATSRTVRALRQIRVHGLRHTFASLLLQQGESVVYVNQQLGHGSIQITVNTYGHLIPGATRARPSIGSTTRRRRNRTQSRRNQNRLMTPPPSLRCKKCSEGKGYKRQRNRRRADAFLTIRLLPGRQGASDPAGDGLAGSIVATPSAAIDGRYAGNSHY